MCTDPCHHIFVSLSGQVEFTNSKHAFSVSELYVAIWRWLGVNWSPGWLCKQARWAVVFDTVWPAQMLGLFIITRLCVGCWLCCRIRGEVALTGCELFTHIFRKWCSSKILNISNLRLHILYPTTMQIGWCFSSSVIHLWMKFENEWSNKYTMKYVFY